MVGMGVTYLLETKQSKTREHSPACRRGAKYEIQSELKRRQESTVQHPGERQSTRLRASSSGDKSTSTE